MRSKALWVLLSLLAQQDLFASFSCPKLFKKIHLEYAFFRSKQIVDSREQTVTLSNYFDLGQDWLRTIKQKLESANQHVVIANLSKIEEDLNRNYFRHAFQNAAQHGAKDLERNNYDFAVNVSTSALLGNNGIYFRVSNPQIKPFPKSLKGRFYANSKVNLKTRERKGYQGHGTAHSTMVEELEKLPEGSYLEWSSTGDQVTVLLFVKLPHY